MVLTRIRALVALCATLSAVLLAGGAQAAPVHPLSPTGHLVPVASAPAELVTTELGAYAAFPSTSETVDGYLTAYDVNTSHYGAGGKVWLRRSADLQTWGEPWQMPDQAAGYAWGVSGLASETAGQGGRLYAAVVRTGWVPNSQTLASVAGYTRFSDDNAATWSPLVALPGAGPHPGGWQFYPGSITVLGDGTVLLAGYGADGHTRLYQSTDRGEHWVAAGELTTSRQLQEPQLCPLGDGRTALVMRSDGTGTDTSQRLLLSVRSSAGVWDAPKVITYDGSGAPACAEVAPGTLAIAYRGWIDRADATRRPLRVLMVSLAGWGRGNLDLLAGVWGRFLYGSWAKDPAGAWRLVYAMEGPNGSTAASAAVWSLPVAFREVVS